MTWLRGRSLSSTTTVSGFGACRSSQRTKPTAGRPERRISDTCPGKEPLPDTGSVRLTTVPVPIGERRFSGKFNVRVPESLHRELALAAAEERVSLNRLVSDRLAHS